MKRWLVGILFAAGSLVPLHQASAEETTPFSTPGRFGLGIGGTNITTGISGKLFFANNVAAQATLGFWFDHGFAGNLDVLAEMPALVHNQQVGLNWYAGAGGVFGGFERTFVGGVAGVLGLGLQIKPVPLEFTIEMRPTVFFNDPEGPFWFAGGGAIRYFFK